MNTIELNKPAELNSSRVKKEVENLIKKGTKTNEINLRMNFICDAPELIINDFRKLKNHIALNNSLNN
jgi:hypothetical protein